MVNDWGQELATTVIFLNDLGQKVVPNVVYGDVEITNLSQPDFVSIITAILLLRNPSVSLNDGLPICDIMMNICLTYTFTNFHSPLSITAACIHQLQ